MERHHNNAAIADNNKLLKNVLHPANVHLIQDRQKSPLRRFSKATFACSDIVIHTAPLISIIYPS